MKNLVNVLIGLSVISFVLAILTRIGGKPILGAGALGLVSLTVVLLLFAITLSVKK